MCKKKKTVAGSVMSVWNKELHLGQIVLDSKNQNLGMNGVGWQKWTLVIPGPSLAAPSLLLLPT